MMRRFAPLTAAMLLVSTPAFAQRADLPPEDKVAEALDGHPDVAAAAAQLASARAQSTMLQSGSHEITINSSAMRRTVDREGGYSEFDVTVSRAIRLPGKASLDQKAGALGVEVAENQMEDVRHQTALVLSELWHDWTTASAHYRNDQATVNGLEEAAKAVQRRLTLRDASQLDLDQALAAVAQARTQAAMSMSLREKARVTLAASFPEVPLPQEAPELAQPTSPQMTLQALRDLVLERSHEIRAAEREAQRLEVLAQRARADRFADPTFGVRVFSERGGAETGAGVVASIPLGGGYRRAASQDASAVANAARLKLISVQRTIRTVADTDMSEAQLRLSAWRSADDSARSTSDAATRTARAYDLGQVDLADLLFARRQTMDARRAEIDARSAADRALLKIQIDAHTVWAPDEEEAGANH